MDFRTLFETVPLGTVVSFSDGTPRPPERHRKKLSAWLSNNGTGLVTEKNASSGREWDRDTVCLQTNVHRLSDGTPAIIVNVIHGSDSAKTYEVAERPAAGSAAVLTEFQGRWSLKHLAATPEAAQDKIRNGYPGGYVVIFKEDGSFDYPTPRAQAA